MTGIGGSTARVTDEDRLRGVSGWLLLLPVIIVVQNLTHGAAQIALLLNAPAEDSSYFMAIAVFSGLFLVFCAVGVIGTIKLLREKRSARIWMVIYFGFLILLGLDAPLGLMSDPSFGMLVSTLSRFVMPVAMVAYFFLSRRVKLTLVN